MVKKLISVVAPMYNEQELVARYCAEMAAALSPLEDRYRYELILVNDGSRDMTLTEMQKARAADPRHIAIVNLTRNFGLEGAVDAGLRVAGGDAVVVMDADLQDPPSVILEMVAAWEAGAEVVSAVRKKRASDSFFKRASADLFYRMLEGLSGKLHVQRNAANFRLISRRALETLAGLPEVNRIFRVGLPFIGMPSAQVEYERDRRFAGETKYHFKNMFTYALDSLTGLSVEPLRKLPLTLFLAALSFLGAVVLAVCTRGVWQIGFVMLAILSVLFGALFLCVSVMAEYLAQIMTEVKGRPVSLIYEYTPTEDTNREE